MEQLIYKKSCFNRYFELKMAELHKEKKIKIPMYLSVGQEHIPAAISCAIQYPIFVQHRCHSYFLSFGGSPELLLKELLGREDGINKGRGGSASISMKDFFGHSGLLGDQIPIGVGYAHASQRPTIVITGDAGAEEDYALAAYGYAATYNVPVLIVCEDNDLSILTKKSVRRSWDVVEVAKSFGMNAVQIDDEPMKIYETVKSIKLPALVNIRTCRHLWHAGSGCDGEPEWDRFSMFDRDMEFEEQTKKEIEDLCLNY